MPPGFEPKSGSVSPKQPIASPAASLGSHFRFCASVPNAKIGYMTSDPCTDANERSPESPRSSSCIASPYDTAPTPAQPYSSGSVAPSSPSCAISGITSIGKYASS
jgi:hypothetical protein